MSESESLAPLLVVLQALVAWLQAEKVQGVVIGGVAASILGRPRLTRDVDISVLVEEARWSEFLKGAESFGFVPRRPDALDFAGQSRVLLLHHVATAVDVDVVLGALPFEEEVIARARWITVGDLMLPLPLPEDLVIMKAIAHRPRDLADIEAILDSNPDLDRRRIRRWVGEFSAALDMPDLLQDLNALLARRRRRR